MIEATTSEMRELYYSWEDWQQWEEEDEEDEDDEGENEKERRFVINFFDENFVENC